MIKPSRRRTDLAWAAGIIDGEGCIRAGRPGHPSHSGIQLQIEIGMTHQATIKELHRILRVGSQFTSSPQRQGWKQQYRLAIVAQQAAQVLRDLLPYLRTKRRQAKLLIQLAEEMQGKRRQDLPLKIRRWQDKLIEQIKKEKKNG